MAWRPAAALPSWPSPRLSPRRTRRCPRRSTEESSPSARARRSYDIAKEIEAKTGRETRVAIPGHTQRGGQPDAQDRIFATQCSVEAALGCLRGEFGYMIALRDGKMCHMPLEDVAGKLKYVDPQSDLVREAKALGISFGDE
ncbi:MAG: 6-phosphofructokinase [Collinsella sp.]